MAKHTLLVILIVALIQGLAYVFIIPAWWHYDEPGHFEFAWQIAHFDHWPQYGEVDESMRRQMAASMLKADYYMTMNYKPDLTGSAPVFVGAAPQTTKYALYYILVSLPLRLFGGADFTLQSQVARMVSVALFLLTLYVTWLTLGELLPKGHPLQWLTTGFLALLPGFADTMTAINDDVGAVLAFSVFIWASVRLIKNGPSVLRLLILFLSVELCYWMKNLAWPAIPLSALVVLFSLFRTRWRWVPWALSAVALVAGLSYLFRWGDAADWYVFTPQRQPSRLQTSAAPLGKDALQILATNGRYSYLGQWFSPSQIHSLRNKTVTLGAWMWADQPAQAYSPILVMGTNEGEQPSQGQLVDLTTTPVFYSTTVLIPNDTAHMSLLLQPVLPQGGGVNFFYDGVTLLEGDFSTGQPHYADASASRGTWNGHAFRNLVRNASGQAARLWLNPAVSVPFFSHIYEGSFPANLDVFVASFQDLQGTGWYYRSCLQTLFQTFWARLARDKVGLLADPFSYNVLEVLTILSLPGLLALLWLKRKTLPWRILFFMIVSLAAVWGLALMRGAGTLNFQDPVYSWARYVFPVAILMALALCAGWMEGLRVLGRWLRISVPVQLASVPAFMLGFDVFALISVAYYFAWHLGQEHFILFLLLPVSIFLLLVLLLSYGGRPPIPAAQSSSEPANPAPPAAREELPGR